MAANATAGGALLGCRSVAVAAAAVASAARKRRLRHRREKSGSRRRLQLRYTPPGLSPFLFLQGRRALLPPPPQPHCTDLLRGASRLLQVPRRRSGPAADEADEAPLVEKVLASGKKVL